MKPSQSRYRKAAPALRAVAKAVEACEACPRLRAHCREVARVKRKAFAAETYWGKPITGFGDPEARLLIVGLAPAAHGANRTGRIFTGDRSGDWLYRALHKAGFANRAEARHRNDGLALKDAYISCVVKCAPPDNKPLPDELERCISRHYVRELAALPSARVVLCLGQIALDGLWKALGNPGPRPKFAHGGCTQLPDGRAILMSYHPSQQNTFTGRLTEPMFDSIFTKAHALLGP